MRCTRCTIVSLGAWALALPLMAAAPAAKQAPAKPLAIKQFQATKVIRLSNLTGRESAQLVEALKLALVYDMGYREAEAGQSGWQLDRDTTMTGLMAFGRADAPNGRRTIELATRVLPQLGVHLVAAGSGYGRTSKEALSDYEQVLKLIAERQKELADSGKALGLRRFEFETIQLRYIKVDQALAMLKVLGYNVVELKESIFRKHPENTKLALAKTFEPIAAVEPSLPLIARMVDADRTWIMKDTTRQTGKLNLSVTPDVGGQEMPEVTATDAQQRVMVVFDPADPAALFELKNTLEQHIDVPAKQIVIEAMVIEISEAKLKELGLSFSRLAVARGGQVGITFQDEQVAGETVRPFQFSFDNSGGLPRLREFRATLRMLLSDGSARILSKPSVLALNNHQARIRVGREIPILNSVITSRTTNLNIEYFPIGIVLNIKPRIGADETEVSLQLEAIVSSEDPDEKLTATDENGERIDLAPFIDTRLVQTYARVTNGTPFIIGGLVAETDQMISDRVPFLSKLPLLGRLFEDRRTRRDRSEVIIVITPHIVPEDIVNFSYVVPKDSGAFDSLESRLFRSAYRLRAGDVFDLSFIYESGVLQRMRARAAAAVAVAPELSGDPYVSQFLSDRVPGEAVLVRRQLYDIIKRLDLAKKIRSDRMIFFKESQTRQSGFTIGFLHKELAPLQTGRFTKTLGKGELALALLFRRQAGIDMKSVYAQPVARATFAGVRGSKLDYQQKLQQLNTDAESAILLWKEADLDRLKAALIIKDLIKINSPQEALSLRNFRVGRQVLFPSFPHAEEGVDSRKFYLVDHTVAETFYQTEFYYSAFQAEFDKAVETATSTIEKALAENKAKSDVKQQP